jgi:ribosome-associated protein
VALIRMTPMIAIDERELDFGFARASGPGGQNVNKVETAVQLRFDAMQSPSLPERVKLRLPELAGQRMTKDGVIVIFAQSFRSQERNREDALERLRALIVEASHRPKPRLKTRPTLASKKRRLEAKSRRGDVKRMRRIDAD